jgi:hypothetical protein
MIKAFVQDERWLIPAPRTTWAEEHYRPDAFSVNPAWEDFWLIDARNQVSRTLCLAGYKRAGGACLRI